MTTDYNDIGILLINTGTPDAPTPSAVRRYLREFLSDPRILDMPTVPRWLLVNLIIVPRRARRSAENYLRIWTDYGSPLLVESLKLRDTLRERMPGAHVELGMRYGNPSLGDGIGALLAKRARRIIAVPLFPHYAAATTGSAAAALYKALAQPWDAPPVTVLPEFHEAPPFLDACVAVAQPVLDRARPEHLLFSYHGLPVRHLQKSNAGTGCHLTRADCCDHLDDENRRCYRAQCLETTRNIAQRLDLPTEHYSTSFQSRMGRTEWIGPTTAVRLAELARGGVKRLAVLCPGFTADCLETLEEIGVRGREIFLETGGEEFELVPCLNAHSAWVDALASMLDQFC